MLKNFHSVSGRHRRLQRGMTLVEMLIAVGLSVIVMASLMTMVVFVSTSFKSISNYSVLDEKSRNALDVMGRDIRSAAQVVAYATNYVVLTNSDTSGFSYVWSPSATTLTRNFTNASPRTVSQTILLTNCDFLTFKFYQRFPSSGSNDLSFVETTTASQIKLINVDWRCSRTGVGTRRSTESVQTAQITIRN